MKRILKYRTRAILLIAFIAGASTKPAAQQTDTLAAIRDFVSISTGYKTMPLFLDLEMKNSTNFITGEEDTATTRGQFYLTAENSYVRFGEFEQVINDSLALLISNNLQQMVLYPDAGPVVKKMRSMMGAPLTDSSVYSMAAKYTASVKKQPGGTPVIELQSRLILYGTSLPKETIQLQYDGLKKIPQQVTTVRRELMRIDSLRYTQLKNEPGSGDAPSLANSLFALEGSYFLIKEQVTAYLYREIDQAATVKVPVQVTDRVLKMEAGAYRPVKGYELYKLTINN